MTTDTGMVVGHSGAGFFLPSIAAAHAQTVRLVFVDAGMPPHEGTATANRDFIEQLRSMAVDGILPPWSSWWSDDVLTRLLPDPAQRLAIEAELPEVPLTFYETPIVIPDNWDEAPGGFVLLSESYRADLARAASLGWATVELGGGHLELVNRPDAIARARRTHFDHALRSVALGWSNVT